MGTPVPDLGTGVFFCKIVSSDQYSGVTCPFMGQAKKRRQRNPECAYCGAATDSFDHVPPKCLIPIKRDNLIMVPSCYAHNGGRSGDDEKFAEFLVTAIGRDTPAASAMHEAVKRSFAKNRAKKESFRQRSTYDPVRLVVFVPA